MTNAEGKDEPGRQRRSLAARRAVAQLSRPLDHVHLLTVRKVMDRKRIRFLQRCIPVGTVGAEVGVHKGHFSDVILAVCHPTTLHLIDPWYLLGADWSWGHGDRSTGHALGQIVSRLGPRLATGEVELHIGFDLDVLASFPDASLDWVYLDTSHRYDHTMAQLELLDSKVRPDGVIAGDDWHSSPANPHHGVCRAVREVAGHGSYEILYASDEDLQWAIRATETYRDARGRRTETLDLTDKSSDRTGAVAPTASPPPGSGAFRSDRPARVGSEAQGRRDIGADVDG